jgi:hypothetical protein
MVSSILSAAFFTAHDGGAKSELYRIAFAVRERDDAYAELLVAWQTSRRGTRRAGGAITDQYECRPARLHFLDLPVIPQFWPAVSPQCARRPARRCHGQYRCSCRRNVLQRGSGACVFRIFRRKKEQHAATATTVSSFEIASAFPLMERLCSETRCPESLRLASARETALRKIAAMRKRRKGGRPKIPA